MAFTVKLQFDSAFDKVSSSDETPSHVSHVYACHHYVYESRGVRDPGPDAPTGPLLTLYDENGAQMNRLDIDAGTHVYIMNDRGKTIDHLIGERWGTQLDRQRWKLVFPG